MIAFKLLELGLENDILSVPKNSAAAYNRFIYYPDYLVRLPGSIPGLSRSDALWTNLRTIRQEPVYKGVFKTVWKSIWNGPRDPKYRFQDESVAEFTSRVATQDIADNLVSAILHGIYAGDIDRLSAMTLAGHVRDKNFGNEGFILANLRDANRTHYLDPYMAFESVTHKRPLDYGSKLRELIRDSIAISLKNGIAQLADGLAAALRKSKKVNLLTNSEVTAIGQDPMSSDLTVSEIEITVETAGRVS